MARADTVGRVASGTARYDEIADFYDATAGRPVTDAATAALLEPRPGAGWQQRLPGAAPVPLYLVARCLRR
jgi:hypothetical protein